MSKQGEGQREKKKEKLKQTPDFTLSMEPDMGFDPMMLKSDLSRNQESTALTVCATQALPSSASLQLPNPPSIPRLNALSLLSAIQEPINKC